MKKLLLVGLTGLALVGCSNNANVYEEVQSKIETGKVSTMQETIDILSDTIKASVIYGEYKNVYSSCEVDYDDNKNTMDVYLVTEYIGNVLNHSENLKDAKDNIKLMEESVSDFSIDIRDYIKSVYDVTVSVTVTVIDNNVDKSVISYKNGEELTNTVTKMIKDTFKK